MNEKKRQMVRMWKLFIRNKTFVEFKTSCTLHTSECTECPFRTKYNSSLMKHIKKTGRYKCAKCSYKGKTKQNLKRHLKVDLDIRSYACDYCAYKATRNAYLKGDIKSSFKILICFMFCNYFFNKVLIKKNVNVI